MGILDDAIREHLELKRKHGAPGDDVERLEKEAFGPSRRPDDEEFESGEQDLPEPAEAEATEPVTGEEDDASPFGPDLTVDWDADADDAEGPAAEAAAEPDSGELTPAERARIDYAELDDTADHPAVAGPETGEEDVAAAEPVEPAESAIFDAGDDEEGFGDIDVDLDVEDEPPSSRDAPDSAVSAPTEVQPEQGDDDELGIDFELDDLGDEVEPEAPGTAEQAAPAPPPEDDAEGEDEGSFEADDASEDDLEDEDEDLLEETPDFLQDTPEGERLWFEQGEPKDFDFDD